MLAILLICQFLAFVAAAVPTCPAIDGWQPIYFPHETDCSKFYECSNGTPYLFDCPAGLDFNPAINVCDWPDQAGCRNSTSTAAPSTVNSTTERSTVEPTTPSPTTNATSNTTIFSTISTTNVTEATNSIPELTTESSDTSGISKSSESSSNSDSSSSSRSSESSKSSSSSDSSDSSSSSSSSDSSKSSESSSSSGSSSSGSSDSSDESDIPSRHHHKNHDMKHYHDIMESNDLLALQLQGICAEIDSFYLSNFPNDCTKYVVCKYGDAADFQCPISFIYDKEINICVREGFYNCIV